MTSLVRWECQACGHVLRNVDNGTCPYRVPNADPPHEFVAVEYVPRQQRLAGAQPRTRTMPENGPYVPDEAAIERAAEEVAAIVESWGLGGLDHEGATSFARAVLTAALEQPEPETQSTPRLNREQEDTNAREPAQP